MTLSLGSIQTQYTDLQTANNKTINKVTANTLLADDKVTLGWQQPAAGYQHLAPTQTTEPPATNSGNGLITSDYLQQLLQAMLDQRTGFDREKWEELQEKIAALQSLDELTDGQQQELEQLLKAQEALMQEAADRMRQQAEQQEPGKL
ncbi:hypothetical protein [Alishewanella longhuensis]